MHKHNNNKTLHLQKNNLMIINKMKLKEIDKNYLNHYQEVAKSQNRKRKL